GNGWCNIHDLSPLSRVALPDPRPIEDKGHVGVIIVPASVGRAGTEGRAYNRWFIYKNYIATPPVMETLLNGSGQSTGKLRLLQLRTGEDLTDHIVLQQEISNALLYVLPS